mmetsp:Transcript_32369/g.68993  ORF Transcript_32369/g.68993 Transcript_32369/m.68993 type:complete len:248 (+) Transcript_32369:153-896(+)
MLGSLLATPTAFSPARPACTTLIVGNLSKSKARACFRAKATCLGSRLVPQIGSATPASAAKRRNLRSSRSPTPLGNPLGISTSATFGADLRPGTTSVAASASGKASPSPRSLRHGSGVGGASKWELLELRWALSAALSAAPAPVLAEEGLRLLLSLLLPLLLRPLDELRGVAQPLLPAEVLSSERSSRDCVLASTSSTALDSRVSCGGVATLRLRGPRSSKLGAGAFGSSTARGQMMPPSAWAIRSR